MNIIYSFLRLKWNEKCLLIKTLSLMWLIRVMLWILPFRVIRATIKKVIYIQESSKSNLSIEKLSWAVETAGIYVFDATCLVKALTGQILFSAQNYPSEVKIGVGKDEYNTFEAHAWLEVNKKVVIGKLKRKYIPILSIG
ncbi:lasso peptide biosynthesis B2 protein [Methanobacterium sp. ACI-7]|uniref:lasso peptide biosynthesis B2 protein n=1 Tax=unclassified Methanobacterium TaxID=2627676 RepID=UPI0039C370B8